MLGTRMPLSETSDCTSFSAAEKSDTSWITSSPRSYSRCPCRADGTAGWVSQSRARDECQPQCAVLPGHPAACPACQCGGFPTVGPAGRGLQYFGSEVGGVSTCEGLQRDLTQMWGCLGGTCVPARSQEILKVTIGYL